MSYYMITLEGATDVTGSTKLGPRCRVPAPEACLNSPLPDPRGNATVAPWPASGAECVRAESSRRNRDELPSVSPAPPSSGPATFRGVISRGRHSPDRCTEALPGTDISEGLFRALLPRGFQEYC